MVTVPAGKMVALADRDIAMSDTGLVIAVAAKFPTEIAEAAILGATHAKLRHHVQVQLVRAVR